MDGYRNNPYIFGNKAELQAALGRIHASSDPESPWKETTMDETTTVDYASDARIVGMIPAPGWEMVYLDEQGQEATARLVAWAMTDEGVVRGLIVAASGEVVFGDLVQDFRGYNDRGENADVATALETLNTTLANQFGTPHQGVFPTSPGTAPAYAPAHAPIAATIPDPFSSSMGPGEGA